MITAFPFSSLPKVTQLRQPPFPLGSLGEALSELCGEAVSVTRVPPTFLPAATTCAVFASPNARIAIEADGALVAAIVARALKQKPPRMPGANASAVEQGSFAAVMHAALRRVLSVPVKILGMGANDVGGSSLSMSVRIAGETFGARLTMNPPDPAAFDLEAMADVPLSLSVVADTVFMLHGELAVMGVGDALVLPEFPLRDLVGPVTLIAPGSERGAGADLAADGRLVLNAKVVHVPWGEGMNENSNEGTLQALEDAPVVVRVEIGTVTMTAREWSALGKGDAFRLGGKLGSPVTLRIGGVAVAQAELVQIEGEYGVRIL